MITLETHQLKNLMSDAAELGADKALVESGVLKPFLTQTEAWKIYGRGTVDRWIKEGLIIPQKDGGKNAMVRLDRMTLKALSKTSNRHTYLTVEERKSK